MWASLKMGRKYSNKFWPLWVLIKAMILPYQGNSSPLDIRQQAECSLYEYKLDDQTLQKAQLQQHNLF